jgi:hypothetical protein
VKSDTLDYGRVGEHLLPVLLQRFPVPGRTAEPIKCDPEAIGYLPATQRNSVVGFPHKSQGTKRSRRSVGPMSHPHGSVGCLRSKHMGFYRVKAKTMALFQWKTGSPGCNIGRTFRAEFRWTIHGRRPAKRKVRTTNRNPVALALEWRRAIDNGLYSSQADLARKKGISRPRVTQILNLLRLSPGVLELLLGSGDPLHERTVTERQLRRLIDLPAREQQRHIMAILARL